VDYSTLKTTIAGWLNRTDLTAIVPTFIALAELDIARKVRAPEMLSSIPGVASDFAPLPVGVVGVKSVSLPNNDYRPVSVTTEAELDKRRGERKSRPGLPEWCAVVGRRLEFDVTVDPATNLLVRAYMRLAPLSDAAPTHALLDSHWDLYLYGALAHAAPYLEDDARVTVWVTGYARAMDGIAEAANGLLLGGQLNTKFQGIN
jgi:hypothetical protein